MAGHSRYSSDSSDSSDSLDLSDSSDSSDSELESRFTSLSTSDRNYQRTRKLKLDSSDSPDSPDSSDSELEWRFTRLSTSDRNYQKISKLMKSEIESHPGYRINILNIEAISHATLAANYARRKSKVIKAFGTANERLLYHGSLRSHQIAEKGFNINLANPSGLFGPGIYFADDAFKSASYADGFPAKGRSKMLLCLVVLGKEYRINVFKKFNQPPAGYQSVHGTKGHQLIHDEYIVYNDDQALPGYVVTYDVNVR